MAKEQASKTIRIDIPPEILEAVDPTRLRRKPVRTGRRAPGGAAGGPAGPPSVGDRDFQDLFQSVYDAVLITDLDGVVVDANARAVDFLGRDREELARQEIDRLISGADRSLIPTILSGLETDRFLLLQAYCERRDGSLFPAEISINRLRVSAEERLCFFIRDITERKQAEEQLRTESNLIHNASNGAVVTDVRGTVRYANPAVLRMWGFDGVGDVVDQNIGRLFADPEAVEAIVAATSGAHRWSGEVEARRRDGSGFYAHVDAALNLNSEGEMDGFVFSFLDITARRRAEEGLKSARDELESRVRERTVELMEANEKLRVEIGERRAVEEELRLAIGRLEELDRERSRFVSNVSHELKTPLASMNYATENLLSGIVGEVPPRVHTYLGMIHKDCMRLTGTVNDILDLSRLEARSLRLNAVKTPFPRFVRRTSEAMKIQAEAKEIALQVSTESLRCFVNCDPRKMERVVSNVIQNAVNFTPEGGAVEVILRADEQEPSWVALDVADNGIGIGAEHLGRVTERYYRVGEHIAGTGLGLALAQELVGLHSGRLEIKSPVPGRSKGTLVSVRLPTVSAPVILIVDDDPVIREMLSKQLGSEGYEVLTCGDSESALDVLAQTKPDGMIVDLILPVMGGAQAIAKIKSDEKLRRIPVMAITGGELDQAKHEILDGFGIPTLAKPWKRDELLDRMEELLLGTGYLER